MAASQSILSWAPDLRLPARASLQEFVSQDKKATLRVALFLDQRAQVEVNDRVVAETRGFRNATALAELYTRSREILLVEERHERDAGPDKRRYYHARVAQGAFEVCSSTDPVAFVHEAAQVGLVGRSDKLTGVVEMAHADAGKPLVPAFAVQEETYRGLGQQGNSGLVVAIWTSRWRTPFVRLLEEDEFTPLFLTVAKASDGACYSIYRLADGYYLSEVRSHHEAEKMGTFGSLEAAVASCDLFNAARHSKEWISLSKTTSAALESRDRSYLLSEETDGYQLRAECPDAALLGRFPSRRIAEAYATAHRDAFEHFRV